MRRGGQKDGKRKERGLHVESTDSMWGPLLWLGRWGILVKWTLIPSSFDASIHPNGATAEKRVMAPNDG